MQGSGVPILDGFLLRLHSIDLSQASSANGLPHALHAHHAHSISFNDLGKPNVSGLSMSKHERLWHPQQTWPRFISPIQLAWIAKATHQIPWNALCNIQAEKMLIVSLSFFNASGIILYLRILCQLVSPCISPLSVLSAFTNRRTCTKHPKTPSLVLCCGHVATVMLRSDSQAKALAAQSAIKLLTPLAERIHIRTQTFKKKMEGGKNPGTQEFSTMPSEGI